ncbi:Inhibitor of growth protein 3 [Borealophlyctis nickersoniae]|nr:Inhibitor of growth protein 3 [Borealophlyctis nickersoniae]
MDRSLWWKRREVHVTVEDIAPAKPAPPEPPSKKRKLWRAGSREEGEVVEQEHIEQDAEDEEGEIPDPNRVVIGGDKDGQVKDKGKGKEKEEPPPITVGPTDRFGRPSRCPRNRAGIGETIDRNIQVINQNWQLFRILDVVKETACVFFIYPRACTAGSTTVALGFKKYYEEFRSHGYQVYGISGDRPKAQKKWKEKHELPFDLLCDGRKFPLISYFGALKGWRSLKRGYVVVDKGGKIEDLRMYTSREETFCFPVLYLRRKLELLKRVPRPPADCNGFNPHVGPDGRHRQYEPRLVEELIARGCEPALEDEYAKMDAKIAKGPDREITAEEHKIAVEQELFHQIEILALRAGIDLLGKKPQISELGEVAVESKKRKRKASQTEPDTATSAWHQGSLSSAGIPLHNVQQIPQPAPVPSVVPNHAPQMNIPTDSGFDEMDADETWDEQTYGIPNYPVSPSYDPGSVSSSNATVGGSLINHSPQSTVGGSWVSPSPVSNATVGGSNETVGGMESETYHSASEEGAAINEALGDKDQRYQAERDEYGREDGVSPTTDAGESESDSDDSEEFCLRNILAGPGFTKLQRRD